MVNPTVILVQLFHKLKYYLYKNKFSKDLQNCGVSLLMLTPQKFVSLLTLQS